MPDRERVKLLNKLCKICSRHRVVPKSMNIPDCSTNSVEVECGGFANVSQGTYNGRQVAVKVVRMYITSDLDAILSVSLPSATSLPYLWAERRVFVEKALLGNTSGIPTSYRSSG